MTKRLADWLEKVSVAAFAVGVFQGSLLGLVIAALALGMSLWMTKRMRTTHDTDMDRSRSDGYWCWSLGALSDP